MNDNVKKYKSILKVSYGGSTFFIDNQFQTNENLDEKELEQKAIQSLLELSNVEISCQEINESF